MDTRTSFRRHRAALALFMVLALAGCDSVYTIHSIASPSDEPSTVPDISGLWAVDADPTGVVLRVAAAEYDIGQCRDATIQLLGESSFDDETLGDEICFVPVAGHLVVQLHTTGQVQLYQQYLFKFNQRSVSLCDAIWADLLSWSNEHPKAPAAYGLEFGRRGGDTTELFVTSSRNALLKYLEVRLPEAAKACDKVDEEGDSGWRTYIRLTPPRRRDAAGAADTSPSQQN